MEKYLKLLSNAADRLARKAEQGVAIVFDLERIECILNAAEREIETAERAG